MKLPGVFLYSAVILAPGISVGNARQLEVLHIIDWHVHVAGLGYGNSGCFISKKMRRNLRYKFFLNMFDVTEEQLEQQGDKLVLAKLDKKIRESRYVDQAVILALDGVIDRHGELDRQHTQLYVPNEFVAAETAKYPALLFGASINPNRPDAIARLEQAHRRGAVLVKWIPSIMDIDPADEKFIGFYRRMAELNLPLLTHAGRERSFSYARDELADPMKLVLPLETGVTVIAAHIATTGNSAGQENFARILPLFEMYPNLYTDISSLTQINKLGYLVKALNNPHVIDRMFYGSDWPLQFFPLVSPWYHVKHIGIRQAWRISRIDNPWDRDIKLKEALGVSRSVFERRPGRAAGSGN
jgi:predicted TIM-barrel fold metal-dependent hydrolase